MIQRDAAGGGQHQRQWRQQRHQTRRQRSSTHPAGHVQGRADKDGSRREASPVAATPHAPPGRRQPQNCHGEPHRGGVGAQQADDQHEPPGVEGIHAKAQPMAIGRADHAAQQTGMHGEHDAHQGASRRLRRPEPERLSLGMPRTCATRETAARHQVEQERDQRERQQGSGKPVRRRAQPRRVQRRLAKETNAIRREWPTQSARVPTAAGPPSPAVAPQTGRRRARAPARRGGPAPAGRG